MPRIKIRPDTYNELCKRAIAPMARDAQDEFKRTGEIILDEAVFERLEGHRALGESWDDVIERLMNTHLIM